MMHGREKSDLAIVAGKPANKAEQSAAEQGECEPAKHVPDPEPDKRVTGAGAHTASICRHAPKVGAVCGKAARTVLCGGRAMKRASLPLQEVARQSWRDQSVQV